MSVKTFPPNVNEIKKRFKPNTKKELLDAITNLKKNDKGLIGIYQTP